MILKHVIILESRHRLIRKPYSASHAHVFLISGIHQRFLFSCYFYQVIFSSHVYMFSTTLSENPLLTTFYFYPARFLFRGIAIPRALTIAKINKKMNKTWKEKESIVLASYEWLTTFLMILNKETKKKKRKMKPINSWYSMSYGR